MELVRWYVLPKHEPISFMHVVRHDSKDTVGEDWKKSEECSCTSHSTKHAKKFQKERIINKRKNLPIECTQGDQPPNRVFCVNEPSAVPWWWCAVVKWPVLIHEVGGRVRWKNAVGCEVTWGEVMWLVARCHLMSCNVTWCQSMPCHLMWCDSLCCVMSRDAMRCHMMCCHVMSCHLLWSDAKDGISWVCDAMWLVVRSDVVNWKMMWWSVLQYYKYYTVLQSSAKYFSVLLHTM